MAVSKVVFGNRVLIDISDSTITQDMLPEGVIAYDSAGNRLVGQHKQIRFSIMDYSVNAIVYQDTVEEGTKWSDYVSDREGFFHEADTISYESSPVRYDLGQYVLPDDVIVNTTYMIN